jgi:serine/threonine-protein kinase
MEPGHVISGRYKIDDQIGKGGHGKVFRATDLQTTAPVAIKVMHAEVAKAAEFRTRMEREARAMCQLSGTNAVQVMAFDSADGGELYIVMEHLDGADLGNHLRAHEKAGQFLPIHELYEILEPVAHTLTTAHERHIYHRDIKPSNVFVLSSRARGRSRLLDFGLVKDMTVTQLTKSDVIAGSPGYIAPECWLGKRPVDHRMDVYSFGVLVFRCLAGRPPFNSKRPIDELLIDVTRSERPSLHKIRYDLHPSIDEWVKLALAIDRDHRFDSVTSLWTYLDHVLRQKA